MKKQQIPHRMRWPASRPRLRRETRQRFAIGFLALSVALSAGLPAIAGEPHRNGRRDHSRQEQDISAEAKRGRKRVVKKTSNDSAIGIPDGKPVDTFGVADPYQTTIDVQGFKRAKIVDVNLTLRNFSHTYTPDVDVLLVAPGGRNAVVMGDVGDNPDVTNITVRLDDEAANPLPVGLGNPLAAGSFQPFDSMGLTDGDNPNLLTFPAPAPTPSGSDALSTFDGISPNGQWRLFVLDDNGWDTGAIAGGWSLEITAKSKKKRR
jgi:subtilisin-like proprotein convertase family protein